MTPRTQAEILGDKLVIKVTDEERIQFLRWLRDFSSSRELGRPGVRACYYYLRDKPWSFIVPDYETTRPNGAKKKVLWSEWVKNNLIAARKRWIVGDRGPLAFDPDLLDDDGDAKVVRWQLHENIDAWVDDIPELDLEPWEGQPKRVIVLCEKAGMRGIVKNACMPTRTEFMCCGGDASMRQKQNVGKWVARVEERGLQPVILYAGDHDMQGVNMDRTWVRDVAEIESVTRVAVTLEQARDRNLPMENARDKLHEGANLSDAQTGQNTKIENYIAEHGEDMIELNALVVVNEFDLRDIIRDAIEEHIDAEVWNARQNEIAEPRARIAKLIKRIQAEVA